MRRARAVGWSIGTWLVLWLCDFTAAQDIPISTNYVIKKQDSCPDVGYYFRRESSPNAVDPGPCLLCFCKEPGTAACWVRDSVRCDVENYTLNTTESDLPTRVRRSPLGIGDIFFRDAARDFFNKNLPEQCKPNEDSFSDGCPPADWCLGCTVCDCDANGRWDCHILSFCNEEERKKQLKGTKLPLKNTPKPPTNKNAKRSFQSVTKKTTKKPTKPTKKTDKPAKQAKKPTGQAKKPAKPAKKPTKSAKKPTKTTKPVNRTLTSRPQRRVVKRVVKKVNKTNKTNEGNPKPPQRRIVIKKRVNNKTIKQKRESPKQIHTKRLTKKELNSDSVQKTNKVKSSLPPNSEYQMGQMLVKKVMSSVQKMVKSELDRINKTAIEKGLTTSDCEDIHNRKKKEKSKEFKYKRIGQEFRWMRSKRDIGNEPTTSIYDNGIGTTTDLDTGPSIESNKPITLTSAKDLILATTSKSLLSDIILSKSDDFDARVRPLDKTTENNLVVNNNINNYNIPTLKFQIVVNDDINTTDQSFEKNSHVKASDSKDQFLDKWPLMSNYKYNIGHEPIDNSIQISTTITPNTIEKDVKNDVISLKTDNKKAEFGSKRHSLIKKIITKGYKNLSDIYFPSKDISTQKKVDVTKLATRDNTLATRFNKTRKLKNKINFLKYIKNILNKLIHIGKKSNRLGQEDEYQIVKILCENMKSCKVNKKNRKLLNSKIKMLNAETKTIFRTIKIIKGLLHLIEIPDIDHNVTNFKNDIKKLNAILKGNNLDGINLTATQKTQIEYLKTNTKTFITAVSKFTSLVNEVTAILQKSNKREIIRNSRYAKKNMTESFDKIKKILLKHNLVENTFIKKIYTMLTDLELKVSNKTKVSDKRINSFVINKYSRDIIDNLRMLRDLAQTLNSSRRKRQISGDDDTMEHLLILLEYLLKKDSYGTQLNKIEPVHDGIDVLIDTIKNAPDIKDIKKKVLGGFHELPKVIQTANFKASDENETATIETNQLSESNSASKESNFSRLSDILMELKSEALKDEDTTELIKSSLDDEESQNIRDAYNDPVLGVIDNPYHDHIHDVRRNPYHDATQSVKGNPYHDLAQSVKDVPHHDLTQSVKGNSNHDPAQNVKGIPYHDTAQSEKGIPYHDPAESEIGNPYHDTAQEVRDSPYSDLALDVRGSPYNEQNMSYEDIRQNHKDNLNVNENLQNLKHNSNEDKKQILKGSPSEDNTDVSKNNPNDDGLFKENLENIRFKDISLNDKESMYDESVIPNMKGDSYKDVIKTQARDTNDEITPKISPYEDATQIVRAIPLEDISQNVYYERIDENATNYELYENVTVPMTETTTPEPEKLGFDKFENSIDIEKKLESDSEDEDTYHVANRTRETKSKAKEKDADNNNNQTAKYVDSNQSLDSTGNLEWIEENFGKELANLKDKFIVYVENTPTTTAKVEAPTLTSRVTQPTDMSDVSNESDAKKEKKLSTEEVMYRKQMDLLNSLDYGTEKNEFEDTKSEDDMGDSIFA